MTAPTPAQIHEERNDNRLYYVNRNSRQVKRHWHQMSDAERKSQFAAEARAKYCAEFNIY
jgi:hypothetical protein